MYKEDNLDNLSFEDLQEYAKTLGLDLSKVDLDSITLPPDQSLPADSEFIIKRYIISLQFNFFHFFPLRSFSKGCDFFNYDLQ